MTGQEVTISGRDGDFSAYLAGPASGRGPGVVVIQEIFGVNDGVRAIADHLARRGFFALAPDLFWRLEPGVRLKDNNDTDLERAFGFLGRFDADKGIEDIQAGIDHLRSAPGVSGKVGAVGYCLGGKLAYMTATRTDSDASVGYYGIMIQDMLGEAANLKKPLMLHIAEEDEFVPHTAQHKIAAGLKGNPRVSLHFYPHLRHAFARPGGKHYDKAGAELANSRTHAFFHKHLG